jgi:hypothetical protein
MGGPAIPFRLATLILALAECEELAITAILPTWQSEVPSLLHARQLVKSSAAPTKGNNG